MALLHYDPPQEPYLKIIYHDDHLLVADKPSGLLSVSGNQPQFLDSLMWRVKQKYGFCEPAHRLDMATSGIMCFAMSKLADRELKRQFREREPKKHYQALVYGHIDQKQGEVNLPLICDWENRPRQRICFENGKPASTLYEVLELLPDNITRVKLTPITGRSHQLRLHMLALSHPILGDKFYAPPRVRSLYSRLALHAQFLQITHPKTGKVICFESPVPF